MLFGMIVLLGVGILFLALGTVLWKKRKISLVHEYHIRNVREEDVPAYTRLMGLGLIAIGAGCVLTGVAAFWLEKPVGWIGLPLGFLIGITLILRAQWKYNGGRILS